MVPLSYWTRYLTLVVALCTAWPASRAAPLPRTAGSARIDWTLLDDYQFRITRVDFETRVNEIFSRDGEFWKYTRVDDEKLIIYRDATRIIPVWTLYFALPQEHSTERKRWQPAFSSDSRPLRGLVVCLDPGHIGGEWARTEHRWFRIGEDPPIIEWELNLLTSRHIEAKLTELGATVVWTKTDTNPSTDYRPYSLRNVALLGLWRFASGPEIQHRASEGFLPELIRFLDVESNRVFYRFFEISARAERVRVLSPHITIAVHYNAAPWGDPDNPRLVNTNHLVIFVHGSYMADELKLEDHRFHLVRKVLANDIIVERGVAEEIARQYARIWPQWRPANYGAPPWTMPLPESPYVYARNLLANRLFEGPVVFVEGPFMNSNDAYPRLLAGDYEGLREINGQMVRSIHREYAEAVVEGLREFFTRGALPEPPLPTLGEEQPLDLTE